MTFDTGLIIQISVSAMTVFGVIVYARAIKSTKTGEAMQEVLKIKDEQIKAYGENITLLEGQIKDQAKEFNETLREREDKFNKQLQDMTREVGELKGQLAARDGEKKVLIDTLTLQNPEMKQFFTDASNMMKENNVHLESAQPILENVEGFLEKMAPIFERLSNIVEIAEGHLKESGGNLPTK